MHTQRPETVILLNSLATTAAMWDGVLAGLPEDVRATTLDQRDQRTGAAAAPFTLDDLVDDAVAALDADGVERAHVAGVSLGGIVALHAAATRPDRFVSVTAMCCAARFPSDVWRDRAASVRASGLAPLVPAILDRWFAPSLLVERPELVRRHRAMLESSPSDGYALACDLLADADVTDALPSIAMPALVISGALDPANPIDHQRSIVDLLPDARHEVIDDAAHLVPASHPFQVAALLVEHVRRSAHAAA